MTILSELKHGTKGASGNFVTANRPFYNADVVRSILISFMLLAFTTGETTRMNFVRPPAPEAEFCCCCKSRSKCPCGCRPTEDEKSDSSAGAECLCQIPSAPIPMPQSRTSVRIDRSTEVLPVAVQPVVDFGQRPLAHLSAHIADPAPPFLVPFLATIVLLI